MQPTARPSHGEAKPLMRQNGATAYQIRKRYIDFFINKYNHKEIPSASIIPENDPTVLFTTAGMHPLVPYLIGEPHPAGKRLVNAQKCLRTDDIDEVGDTTHCTFFEMLGNWSLGDYFKEEAIKMSYELLATPWNKGGFGLDVNRLSVSCFEGDSDAPRDTESAEIWEKMGIPRERIYFFSKKKNWWGPAGQTGPCGPDTEMFYDVLNDKDLGKHLGDVQSEDLGLVGPKSERTEGKGASPSEARRASGENRRFSPEQECDPACDCGRYVEVWNDVFMQYNKKADGVFEPLKQKNVDTGLGFERIVLILQGKTSPFETELFWSAILEILSLAGREPAGGSSGSQGGGGQDSGSLDSGKIPQEIEQSVRIIADHLRAATFILGDKAGMTPSNVDQGYIIRRLIRRAIRHGNKIGIPFAQHGETFTPKIAVKFIELYGDTYSELKQNRNRILGELEKEERQFSKTIERGLKELKKFMERKGGAVVGAVSGAEAFYIFETYGFPLEMIEEELAREEIKVDRKDFQRAFDESFKKHQELSRAGATQKFSGGLADHSEQTKMHHTATHLVQQALRDVLGNHIFQKGSNVTAERLRFDFSHPEKLTPEQIKKVEDIVNEQIERDLPVHFEILDIEEAKRRGAIGVFEDKYAQLGNKIKVYFVGDYSKEVCGGPHVTHTGALKHFKITKEQACSAGIRRIKAVVEGIRT